MAQSFIFKINSVLKINEDIEDDDFFELEWNQFSAAIWEFSGHVLKTKSDEKISDLRIRLKNSTNLKDQIRYVFEDSVVYEEAQACASLLITNNEIASKKDLNAARSFAENAEMHASNNELKNAISNYNKAISLLDFTADAHDLQRLLQERAKVLFDAREFEASLADIEDAIEFANTTQSTDIYDVLWSFKTMCLQKIGERRKYEKSENTLSTAESNVLAVPFLNENELLPGVSSKIEMAYSSESGRIIKAKTDIHKGTILCSEPAFASWLRPSKYKRYCFYCIKQLNMRYFPCRRCNIVRYCSFDCERKAWNGYHKVDCEFLPELQKMSYGYLATKILLTQGIDDALLEETDDFTDLSQFPTKVFPQNYSSFASLITNSDKLCFEHLFALCCGVIVLMFVLEKMKLIERQAESYFDVSATIFKLINRINLNCYLIRDRKFRPLSTTGITLHTSQGSKLGVAIYLSSSLISHSCDYNSLRVSNGASMLLLSDRDIKKGEEITVSYCLHYQKMSYKDRQKFLSENYYFDCRCCACNNGLENIEQALKCNSCNGPLIWNEDHSNYCLYCSEQCDSIEESLQQINETNELCNVSSRLINACEYDEAIKQLLKIERVLDSIYFSDSKQMKVKEKVSLCFELKENFKTAFKFLKGTIKMRMEVCGSEHLEVVCTLIHCIYLLKNQMKNRLDFKKRRQIRYLRRRAIKIMKTYQNSDVLLLDKSYMHSQVSVEYFTHAFEKYTSRYGLSFKFLKL